MTNRDNATLSETALVMQEDESGTYTDFLEKFGFNDEKLSKHNLCCIILVIIKIKIDFFIKTQSWAMRGLITSALGDPFKILCIFLDNYKTTTTITNIPADGRDIFTSENNEEVVLYCIKKLEETLLIVNKKFNSLPKWMKAPGVDTNVILTIKTFIKILHEGEFLMGGSSSGRPGVFKSRRRGVGVWLQDRLFPRTTPPPPPPPSQPLKRANSSNLGEEPTTDSAASATTSAPFPPPPPTHAADDLFPPPPRADDDVSVAEKLIYTEFIYSLIKKSHDVLGENKVIFSLFDQSNKNQSPNKFYIITQLYNLDTNNLLKLPEPIDTNGDGGVIKNKRKRRKSKKKGRRKSKKKSRRKSKKKGQRKSKRKGRRRLRRTKK